ncbi:MAG TPA: hypothetical protein VFN83_04070, partial [Gemmatimonadales bacterium]|nr:hypothetical protein [Gemmatimonadales bacterium]
MVAIVILAVGVLGMLTTSSLVTRMIGRGKVTTRAAQVAETRLEILRQLALSSTPSCSTWPSGTTSTGTATTSGLNEAWTVTTPATSTKLRQFSVTVTYPVTGGTRTATVSTIIRCP